METQLTIGMVARMFGITTKTIRHYHKIGLLSEPARTINGYRCYTAADLVRLQRIKRLQTAGLSLTQIKAVLGAPDRERSLREVLESVGQQIDTQLLELTKRRAYITHLLADQGGRSLDYALKTSPTVDLFLGQIDEQEIIVSDELVQLDSILLGQMDLLFGENAAYQEQMRELAQCIAKYPADYKELVALGERFLALAHELQDSSDIERMVEDYCTLMEHNPVARKMQELNIPEGFSTTLFADLMGEIAQEHFSSAQQQFLMVLEKHLHINKKSTEQ